MSGQLFIVATPIGNLEDMTLRAIRVLKEVHLIACEDTRTTKILLDHYGIQNQLTSFFEHNEARKIPEIMAMLEEGKNVAVVSDAGTPTISDPAFKLVREAHRRQIAIVPVPGANAAIAAISAAGLPTDSFVFEGFLPHKKGRKTRWEKLATEERTIVLYESPFRVIKTLEEIQHHLGNRTVVIARELTKKFEQILSGSVSEIIQHFKKNAPRGEFVILITGKRYHEKQTANNDEE